MTMSASLSDLFFRKQSKDIDKWEQYPAIYDRGLRRFVDAGEPITLLEIGVQNGGSLELWSEYLPEGSSIVGVDIDPAVAGLAFDSPNIAAHVFDATDAQALEACLGGMMFDVIIDDGSHRSSDIIKSFQLLFDRLKPGGLFFIEDLHCSYYPSHEGGLRDPRASIEWLKSLVDSVNYDHIEKSVIASTEDDLLQRYNRGVAGISFYDSVAVVEKFAVEKHRPFRRIYSGVSGTVEPVHNWLAHAPYRSFASMLFGQAAAREIDLEMGNVMRERAERIAALEHQRNDLQAQLDGARLSVAAQAEQLAAALAREGQAAVEAENAAALLAQAHRAIAEHLAIIDQLRVREAEIGAVQQGIDAGIQRVIDEFAARSAPLASAIEGLGPSIAERGTMTDAAIDRVHQQVEQLRDKSDEQSKRVGKILALLSRSFFKRLWGGPDEIS
jgi:SAM-dependent methyltransferase